MGLNMKNRVDGLAVKPVSAQEQIYAHQVDDFHVN